MYIDWPWHELQLISRENYKSKENEKITSFSIDRDTNCKLLSRDKTIERGVPGQGVLGLFDVVRQVVQVVAQEMYLEKLSERYKLKMFDHPTDFHCGQWGSLSPVCTQQIEVF